MSLIHPTALIDSEAQLHETVSVGPYSIIGPGVEIGANTWIGPHVVINGPCRIGCDNRIFQFCSIGEMPQDKKYANEPTRLEIGDRNVIREGCTLNRGTIQDQGLTRIGDDNWIMAYVHVAHDCMVGNRIILANNVALAGHVSVGDDAILGGFTLVHQFCAIGQHAFSAMGTAIGKDVPPYMMVSGNPVEVHGMNAEGLKRRGFGAERLSQLRKAYKILYRSGLTLVDAKQALTELATDSEDVALLLDFLHKQTRGIAR
ncbi:MAG: acyl-ACP--UDP-N-acetylglucosamine O-acyltransferase [Thiohalomonadaceae bacterium]